jgi:hypothetical protein
MDCSLRQDAEQIVRSAIEAVQPGEVVKNLLRGKHRPLCRKVYTVRKVFVCRSSKKL